ncbi:hypothetical protein POM88_018322 [Heracleum sosnowskyi]|uniref:Uncharacterized protein n=1 Tax=Heracleum sosnowskyi TaxID=360622 RepID=A0AAD8IQB0_9APIA|nr:hypothetical protein POM88_018322 [Heracleum sosnowskyi]
MNEAQGSKNHIKKKEKSLRKEGEDKVEEETSMSKDNQVNLQQMSKNQRRNEKETRKRAEAFARLKVEEETSKNKDDEEREDEHPKGKVKQVEYKDNNKEFKVHNFKVPFFVSLSEKSKDGNFLGTTATDSIVLDKTFVCATKFQSENFSKLQSLCASNKRLLSVDNTSLVICERADGFDEFFAKEFKRIQQPLSKGFWWKHIEHKF